MHISLAKLVYNYTSTWIYNHSRIFKYTISAVHYCYFSKSWYLRMPPVLCSLSFWILTVHGVEYAFGAHDYPSSGVFEVEPRQCPGFKFRKSIFMGTTSLDPFQIREFMERQSAKYNGDAYHLIVKNCNHFSEDICYKLTGNSIPKWVNRLARIGIWWSLS